MRYLVLAPAYLWLAFAVSETKGDENPFDAVYRSLDKWGRSVRQQLQEEATPTPAKRRLHHLSTVHHHPSPSPSPKSKPTDEEPARNASPSNADGSDQDPKAKKKTSEDDTDGSSSKHIRHRESDESSPTPTPKETPSPTAQTQAAVASLDPSQLKDFDKQPQRVQDLIRSALALTQRNLAYSYGSADPGSGGMDCSGFIYYVLSGAGFKDIPRQSSDQYLWVRKNGNFHSVLSRNANTFELEQLRPGDLMFWSGTYKVDRDVPITHVMIYLGKQKGTNKPIMVGASDGRSYNGERRFGVSVFDFKLPNGTPNKSDPDLVARFEGYSSIPSLRDEVYTVRAETPAPTPAPRPFLRTAVSPQPKPTAPKLLSNGD